MKRIYFLLCMLTISTGLSATITISPTTDVPSFKCKYSESYSVAGLLEGVTYLRDMAALMKLVIVAEDGQQYWYPITESTYYTFTDRNRNIALFYAEGNFCPTSDQVCEIKKLKITAAYAVLYQLDVNDPKMSINSPDLHFDHSSILYHSELETPIIPGTLIQAQEWTEDLQAVIDNWDPSKAVLPPSSAGTPCLYNEYSDLNVLYSLDSTIQVVASLTQKSTDIAQCYVKHINLNFDDGTNLSLPVLTNVVTKDKKMYRVAGCSEPISFNQLRDKHVTSLSIETSAGIVQGENSKLVDALNNKINISEYPSSTKSSYYTILSQMEALKVVPQIFLEPSAILPDFYRPGFAMEKDKSLKKFNVSYEGKEIISPIFPQKNFIVSSVYWGCFYAFRYNVDKCQKIGITQDMLTPIWENNYILPYFIKSTKERGFINKDAKRIAIHGNIKQFNQDNIVLYNPIEAKWQVCNMDGEILVSSKKQIKLFTNGLFYKDNQFYYPSLEPIIPVAFPTKEYSLTYNVWTRVEFFPRYKLTANGVMYFDNCMVESPSGIIRNMVIAIPEKK